jgi:WD40 repeat protein
LGLAFNPAGDVLASNSDDGTVRLWDVQSGAELAVLEGPRGFAMGVVFSPDGRLLFAGCGDGTLRIWGVD